MIEADSARAAALVDAAALACALLDLDLGDGYGVEVAEVLRSKRSDLPVAFFSGGADLEQEKRARALGPWFAKPADLASAIAWAVETTRT